MQFINELSKDNIHEIIDSQLLIIPILRTYGIHWCTNEISFVYIYDVDKKVEYVFNCHHSDYNTHDIALLDELNGVKYIYKQMSLPLDNSHDMELVYWYTHNLPIGRHKPTSRVHTYYNWYRNTKYVNDIIPIYNFLDYIYTIKNVFLDSFNDIELNRGFEVYELLHKNLKLVETNGLYVNTDISLLKIRKSDQILYSEYNLFTSTGRPSNKYGGVNFAALPKVGGIRDMFIPRSNGILVEFDYDSFHLRLASKLIKYNLPDENLHDYFGRQYFNVDSLSEEQYEQSKAITFRLLNGMVDTTYQHIKFFTDVYEYREKLWDEFLENDEIELPFSKRKLKRKYYDNMSSSKLFNYVLQATETEFNSIIINKINTYLLTHKSKLILYTYDSFLIDFDLDDGKDLILELCKILNINGFHVKMKIGNNYGNMASYTIN